MLSVGEFVCVLIHTGVWCIWEYSLVEFRLGLRHASYCMRIYSSMAGVCFALIVETKSSEGRFSFFIFDQS